MSTCYSLKKSPPRVFSHTTFKSHRRAPLLTTISNFCESNEGKKDRGPSSQVLSSVAVAWMAQSIPARSLIDPHQPSPIWRLAESAAVLKSEGPLWANREGSYLLQLPRWDKSLFSKWWLETAFKSFIQYILSLRKMSWHCSLRSCQLCSDFFPNSL